MEAFYKANHIKIYNKDCRDMSELPDESADLIVTDPPYQLSSTSRARPDQAATGSYGKEVPFSRQQSRIKGFMGKEWDVLPPVEVWQECLRVLKPGAFAFIMTTPRQDSLCQILSDLTNAGFQMGFSSIYWAYASGFPKAQNIGKAVDKRLGAEREVVGQKVRGNVEKAKQSGSTFAVADANKNNKDIFGYGIEDLTLPATPQAKALDGSYGGFQAKPAVEVILVVMKPLSEKTFVDQALKNRKGITWLDDCRIPYESEEKVVPFQYKHSPKGYGYRDRPRGGYGGMKIGVGKPGEHQEYSRERECNPTGRFPANLLVSDDVLNDGRMSKGTIRKPTGRGILNPDTGWNENSMIDTTIRGQDDSGSFSRYFDLDKWAQTLPFLIVPKASKSEKNRGCEDMTSRKVSRMNTHGGNEELGEAWHPIDDKTGKPRDRFVAEMKNYHPTVKPLKLMSYLITLGSREGDTVVDPFIGTGSTAIACQILGRSCTGYEINPDYCKIAKGRLTYYCQKAMNL